MKRWKRKKKTRKREWKETGRELEKKWRKRKKRHKVILTIERKYNIALAKEIKKWSEMALKVEENKYGYIKKQWIKKERKKIKN